MEIKQFLCRTHFVSNSTFHAQITSRQVNLAFGRHQIRDSLSLTDITDVFHRFYDLKSGVFIGSGPLASVKTNQN